MNSIALPIGPSRVLVLGATGYVGGRLVPRLLDRGVAVVAAGRSLAKLRARPWSGHAGVRLAACDALDPSSLRAACAGVEAVFYLVHSMDAAHPDFAEADRRAARNVRDAAAAAGVRRIIYLGGLGGGESDLSEHLCSRHEVGAILADGSVPVLELRAAMILGSGSASFEILRYLVERLPVMVTPRWVRTRNQPIAIRDVLMYLEGSLAMPIPEQARDRVFDIGGPEVLTYQELMAVYAEEAGLPPRLVLPVPVLTPTLSSYWIHLVTPVPAALARPLAEGLRNPVVCREERIRALIPLERLAPRAAIRLAIERTRQGGRETCWTDAGPVIGPAIAPERPVDGDPAWAGGALFRDDREGFLPVPVSAAWRVVSRLGGETGWYHADWLWRVRGLLDRLVGGVGLRRGRRDPEAVGVGDALDFWRVVACTPERELVLAAEMKLPGEARLAFRMEPVEGGCRLTQSARFRPRGLAGLLYWYAVVPLHEYVFAGMFRAIGRAAQEADRASGSAARDDASRPEAAGPDSDEDGMR